MPTHHTLLETMLVWIMENQWNWVSRVARIDS
jgi:hypothetical protein